MSSHTHAPEPSDRGPAPASLRRDEAHPPVDLPQRDLRAIVGRVQGLLAGRTVVEPVCGDGWWTQHLAQAAHAVTALEADASALRRAAGRRLPPGRVRLMEAPPGAVARLPGAFDGGFLAFPYSMTDPPGFQVLDLLHRRLGPGGMVVVVDARDDAGAMTEPRLRAHVRESAPDAQGLRLQVGERLWCLSYIL